MDQQKTGALLKELRKERGMTQAQLAEVFQVSNRTVSRWETGSNLPDISMLMDLAEYYQVDIRELIDGQRAPQEIHEETKETILKAADYVETEKQILIRRVIIINCIVLVFAATGGFLQDNHLLSSADAQLTADLVQGSCMAAIICTILYLSGTTLKIRDSLRKNKKLKAVLILLLILAAAAMVLLVIH